MLKFLDHIFYTCNWRKITYAVCSENVRTMKIHERLPFVKKIGVSLLNYKLSNNKYYDVHFFEIMLEDYLENRFDLLHNNGKLLST